MLASSILSNDIALPKMIYSLPYRGYRMNYYAD